MVKNKDRNDVVMFQRIARENGMSYGELQVLETLGKVKIRNGRLVKVGDR